MKVMRRRIRTKEEATVTREAAMLLIEDWTRTEGGINGVDIEVEILLLEVILITRGIQMNIVPNPKEIMITRFLLEIFLLVVHQKTYKNSSRTISNLSKPISSLAEVDHAVWQPSSFQIKRM